MKIILFIFLMYLSVFAKADANVNEVVKEAYELSVLGTNPKRVYELALKLDLEGNCHGGNILAGLYSSGKVVSRDELKSRELYIKSANEGCANSASLIGTRYRVGLNGYPRDLNKAIYWHSKAFELNNLFFCSDAKYVATIYDENGNFSEALNWYKKVNLQKSCTNQEVKARIQALEVTQQKQAEIMREDPPVAGITLSLGGDAKPVKKSKKKK